MFNMSSMQKKMMGRFFRKVDNVVWQPMTGKIGIVPDDGIISLNYDGSVEDEVSGTVREALEI